MRREPCSMSLLSARARSGREGVRIAKWKRPVVPGGRGGASGSPRDASVVASGSFTQFDASGSVVARGTWSATQFVSFVSFGGPHPGIFGGVLQLTVTLSPKGGPPQTDVPMSITCIVFAPPGYEEGTTVGDFTEKTGGTTLFHLNQ